MEPKLTVVKPHSELFVACPVCNRAEMRIDYVMGQVAGPWYCQFCGAKTKIDTRDYATSGQVLVTSDPSSQRVWLICELLPQSEPVRIAYETLDYGLDEQVPVEDREDERESSCRYLIEEHQCPTNITGSIEAVFVGGDDDAHGIFEYLKTVPRRVRPDHGDTTGSNAAWVEHHAPGLLKGD